MSEILTSKPTFIQSISEIKIVKNEEHKLPPEHTFIWRKHSLNFPQNPGPCRIPGPRETFKSRHDIIKLTQQTFGGGGLRGGHMKFSQIERGDQQFFCCFQGDQKLNRVFHPISITPPRELKNDNSLR